MSQNYNVLIILFSLYDRIVLFMLHLTVFSFFWSDFNHISRN